MSSLVCIQLLCKAIASILRLLILCIGFHQWWHATFNNTFYLEVGTRINASTFFDRLELYRASTGNSKNIGLVNGRVKFVASEYRLTLNPYAPGAEKKEIEDYLLRLQQNYTQYAPVTAKSVRVASFRFVRRESEEALTETVKRGLIISLPIVFS